MDPATTDLAFTPGTTPTSMCPLLPLPGPSFNFNPASSPVSLLSASRPLPSTLPPTPTSSDSTRPAPVLLNLLGAADGESILVIVVEEDEDRARVYGGSQAGDIHVWDLNTLYLRARLSGHTGAVLALQIVKAREWLVSSSGDGTVRVWHTPTLSALYVVHPPHDNVGDIYSLAWVDHDLLEGDLEDHPSLSSPSKGKGRLYAGCQNNSIQWIELPPAFHIEAHSHPIGGIPSYLASSQLSSSPPIHRTPNKFFDSVALRDRPPSLNRNSNSTTSLVGLVGRSSFDREDSSGASVAEHVVELQFEDDHIAHYAHYGYVYCLLIAKSNDRDVLVSGSGDERIKLWGMGIKDLLPVATLDSVADAVLAIAVRDNTLFAGHQGGVIKIWDLDTFTCIRNLKSHTADILTISVVGQDFYSGAADGNMQRWDKAFHAVSTWPAHESIVLASAASTAHGTHLLTGGNDGVIKIWDIVDDDKPLSSAEVPKGFQGPLFHTLSKLVSFRTIADEEHREECRQGALYLKRVLHQLGAETVLLSGATGKNPLVLATFKGNAPSPPSEEVNTVRRKRVLCYGHYDVVSATNEDKWSNDPFEMTGKNGWIYGRGVSDNKGPMLAIAAAASDLRLTQTLDVDLVMIVEGEEETGSAGFQDAIRKNRALIGDIDVILVSNSYWIGEDIPCLTFGLRGVIHATIKINSDQPDLHSGMQGGVVSEPLVDMVRLLASLTDADGRVRIPGFLDDVRRLGTEESALYDAVIERCSSGKQEKLRQNSHISDPRRSLIARWRQPALSIHKVNVAGPSQKTLIPSWATSSVSIRIVPDQSLLHIIEQLKIHLQKAFASLRTHNTLSIEINHVADWWLGDVHSPYFDALAQCIEDEWKIRPLLIREGGSIPSLPFLEREYSAASVHFPMGQASDSAHLPDEKIRVDNLERGKNIISKWLCALPSLPHEVVPDSP